MTVSLLAPHVRRFIEPWAKESTTSAPSKELPKQVGRLQRLLCWVEVGGVDLRPHGSGAPEVDLEMQPLTEVPQVMAFLDVLRLVRGGEAQEDALQRGTPWCWNCIR